MILLIVFRLRNPETAVTLSDEHQDFKWLTCEDAVKLAGFTDMANVYRNFQIKVESSQT